MLKEYTWLPLYALVRREIVRFFRQRSRVIGALGTPVIMWFLLGSGLGHSFHAPGSPVDSGYLEYFFPGTLALIILFTAIFSTMSVIEDRREGFLQSVLVSPVSRFAVVGSKIIGGTILALIQGALVLALAPLIGFSLSLAGVGLALLTMVLLGLSLTSLGFIFAWKLDSVQGYHAIMNIILMPMWLLSGALFPLSGAPIWLRAVMSVNPMTYGVSLLRESLYMEQGFSLPGAPTPLLSLVLTVVFGVVFYSIATWMVSLRPKEIAS